MIQFFGLSFSARSVDVVSLGRDLSIAHRKSTPVVNVRRDPGGYGASVGAAEWTRAASHALQETYLDLPVALRKVWGIGLAGPSGWVALDLEYRPLSDIRLVPPGQVAADIRRWLDADPRSAKRVSAVLSPKDYFRFTISGALASDVTLVSRLGLASADGASWDVVRLRNAGLEPRWFPPVFEAEIRTGQITPEGVERTGLPGGMWLVGGALVESSSMVASGDLRAGNLWAPEKSRRLAYGVERVPPQFPEGFEPARSAYAGHWTLERPVSEDEAVDEAIERARAALERSGLPVGDVVRVRGDAALGAAALASVGSGLVKSWDAFYRRMKGTFLG